MNMCKVYGYSCLALLGMLGIAFVHAAPLPELRFADVIETPTSMPGHRSRNTATDTVMLHVVESLVAFREDLRVGPMLADSWKVSADGKTYRFKLRPGVTFHNGSALTAADVVWSYRRMVDPKSEFACRNMYDGTKGAKVLGVEAPTADSVVFRLERPNALFLEQLASVQCPFAVLHPGSVDAQGNWVKPVGTGPYQFSEWKRGQYLLLTPYRGYLPRSEPPSGLAGAKVAAVDVRFLLIPDAAAQKAALMSGQIDMINASDDNLPPKDPRWNVLVEQGLDNMVLLMQSRAAPLADQRFRRAIASAIDMPALVSAATNGRSTYNPSLVPTLSRYYSAHHQAGYKQNLEETKKLLAEAGYRGETLIIKTNRRDNEWYRLAIATQSMLKKAGIKADIEVLDKATQLSNFREGKFQLMVFGYSARIDPAIMYADVLGEKANSQWSSSLAEKTLAGIEGVADTGKRQAAFEQLHHWMIDDVPLLKLYDNDGLIVVNNSIHGYKTWPLRKPRFFNVTKN
ncbi:MAG: ABC transporter substrate-binding protein [Proteobacteria bacterium]|nr:ABC transporter substrate-binding protein [Pseudomonadota bacterium]